MSIQLLKLILLVSTSRIYYILVKIVINNLVKTLSLLASHFPSDYFCFQVEHAKQFVMTFKIIDNFCFLFVSKIAK